MIFEGKRIALIRNCSRLPLFRQITDFFFSELAHILNSLCNTVQVFLMYALLTLHFK